MTKSRLRFIVEYSADRSRVTADVPSSRFPRLKVDGVGPEAIDEVAADILDIGTTAFLIERSLPGTRHVNRPVKITAEIGLRVPQVWSPKAIEALQELLLFMGWTHWEFRFSKLREYKMPLVLSKKMAKCDRVALFSGGLDSLCGAATECKSNDIQLVSFYTRQKQLQRQLASGLGMQTPIQWATCSGSFAGRGTNYSYRSFLFLCLAAVTARSFGAAEILQFENGILASGIPPSLSGRSTKHAHYRVHRLCEAIFSEVTGGDWHISNPFAHSTKREAFNEMVKCIGRRQADSLAALAESCWYLYTPFTVNGHRKENGLPCGFCVPCIVRQTAHPQKTWRDLRDDAVRNHPVHGRAFREFYGMLRGIQEASGKQLQYFYWALGPQAQDALGPRGGYQLVELKDLFTRFAREFMSTFDVRRG